MPEIAVRFKEASIHLERLGEPIREDDGDADSDEKREYTVNISISPEFEGHYETPSSPDPPSPTPAEWVIASTETVSVNWRLFRDCRRQIRRGGQVERVSWESLFNEASNIFRACLRGERAERIWWSSSDHQIVSFPWESLIVPDNFRFVRGTPPPVIAPRLPVTKPLRLAFIHDPADTNQPLIAALACVKDVEIVRMTGDPMAALRQAACENFELVHIVANAGVSLAQEGILYLRKERRLAGSSLAHSIVASPPRSELATVAAKAVVGTAALFGAFSGPLVASAGGLLAKALYSLVDTEIGVQTCTPGELAQIVRGSRVTLVSLSPQKSAVTAAEKLIDRLLPSVFHSFAAFGSAPAALPTMLLPVGRVPDQQVSLFWPAFYSALAQTNDIELSVRQARAVSGPLPAALFLRHRLRRQFVRSASATAGNIADQPQLIASELAASRAYIERIREIESNYGTDAGITGSGAIHRELERHKELESKLRVWTSPEE